jgi:CBS domain-containing protein
MSPRAACRLEGLGFTRVHDYVGGIADWKGAGLLIEGSTDSKETVADATQSEVVVCRAGETLSDVRSRREDQAWEIAAVVGCDGVVIGRLRPSAMEGPDDELVEEVMESGPATVRPDGLLEPLVERMERRNAPHVLVTTPQGRLIGILFQGEARRLLDGEPPPQIWRECEGCPGRWATSEQ